MEVQEERYIYARRWMHPDTFVHALKNNSDNNNRGQKTKTIKNVSQVEYGVM